MSKEAMEAVLANSKSQRGLRAVLLALAWKTYDRAPPFSGLFTVRSIATLANVGHRQAQADVAALRKLGELVVIGKQGREYTYAVNVALANYEVPDVDNYEVPDVVQASDDTNYEVPDVDNYEVPDVVTTKYPSYRSYKETRNKIKTRGVTSRSQAPARDPTIENETNAETDAEETPPPLPPLPDPAVWVGQPASFVWRATLDYLHEHPDIDGWEVSEDDLNQWAKHVIATLPSPGTILFRAKSELLTAAFRGATSAAIGQLSDHRFRTEYRRP